MTTRLSDGLAMLDPGRLRSVTPGAVLTGGSQRMPLSKGVWEVPSGQGELLQHASGQSDVDPGFGRVHAALVILAQLPVATQPGAGAFHDPTLGQDHEALGGGVAETMRSCQVPCACTQPSSWDPW